MSEPLDIQPYIDRAPTEEDRVLLTEVQASLRGGALRAAYIMTWIACAESLKRRFREAQARDSRAGRIVGEIEDKECKGKSVDSYLIQKALEYGFIQAGEEALVRHVYEMRCLYGHPYELAPSHEQIVAAVDVVVSAVLSKSVMLRHGFIEEQLRLVLSEKYYLDDHQPAVESYADEVSAKIDPSLHLWMVMKLLAKAEGFFSDPSGMLYATRSVWLATSWLSRVDEAVLGAWDCRGELTRSPKIYSSVLSTPIIYPNLMQAVQDTVIGVLIERSTKFPKVIKKIERLDREGMLSSRQKKRFIEAINASSLGDLQKSGLSLNYCAEKALSKLQSHSWPFQNPAAEFLWNCGPSQVEEISGGMQELLGRNILQAADGSSNASISFLANMVRAADAWPPRFVSGILAECFINEKNQYRFKNTHLKNAMMILRRLSEPDRSAIVTAITEGIRVGTPKGYKSGFAERDEACAILDSLSGDADIGILAKQIAACLKSLPGESS